MNLPQPNELTDIEKDDAMGAYLMMFAAWGIGLPLPVINLIASIIYFALNARSSRFVAFHALQSLTSQITVSVINAAALAWLGAIVFGDLIFPPSFLLYLGFAGVVNILYLIFSLIAMVRARHGELYYIPLFGVGAFNRYFGERAVSLDRGPRMNRPPRQS